MPEEFMERYLASLTLDGRDPVTRSLSGAERSGFIEGDAPHWAIESFIPLQSDALVDYLCGRQELQEDHRHRFREICLQIEQCLRQRSADYHSRFAHRYWRLDPDNDSRTPEHRVDDKNNAGEEAAAENVTDREPAPAETVPAESSSHQPTESSPSDVEELLRLCDEILDEAGYRQLRHEDIEQCVGTASQWGVPLSVDFELFEHLRVYARGDVMGTRLRRRLRRLYQPETVSVALYQRMFVVFQLRKDVQSQEELVASALHLRMFKNIPQQDVDMLLPGSQVRISKIDHAKILVPSLGGLLLSLRKIAQFMLIFAALTLYSTVVLVGLVLATLGYIVRSVLGYFQTKNRYLLNLTRNLYFQKLDTNAGAAYRAIQQAHRQTTNEAVLAYYAILSSDQPISSRRLRRRCERLIREAIGVEVDFRVDLATQRLEQLKQISRDENERWSIRARN